MMWVIISGCFGRELCTDYHERIDAFRKRFEELSSYARDVFEVELQLTWKIHIITCHLSQWLDDHPVGLALYSAQTCESAHSDFKKTQKRYLVSEANTAHPSKLMRSVVDYTSRRI